MNKENLFLESANKILLKNIEDIDNTFRNDALIFAKKFNDSSNNNFKGSLLAVYGFSQRFGLYGSLYAFHKCFSNHTMEEITKNLICDDFIYFIEVIHVNKHTQIEKNIVNNDYNLEIKDNSQNHLIVYQCLYIIFKIFKLIIDKKPLQTNTIREIPFLLKELAIIKANNGVRMTIDQNRSIDDFLYKILSENSVTKLNDEDLRKFFIRHIEFVNSIYQRQKKSKQTDNLLYRNILNRPKTKSNEYDYTEKEFATFKKKVEDFLTFSALNEKFLKHSRDNL